MDGIRGDDYVHAVREDPKHPGLLYAGTEHGIYISFDDGGHWQSLSLNLPDTQVSDIAVADNDLVIATHGRSFYVLDDIAPLRQFSPSDPQTTELMLYAPAGAVRRAQPLSIDYALKTKADKLTINILDSGGHVIRTFTAPETKKPTAGDDEGYAPPRPTAWAGSRSEPFHLGFALRGFHGFPRHDFVERRS